MMRKISVVAAVAALLLPSLSFAADAAPDTAAMMKAVEDSGLTCDLGPATVQEKKADHWLVEFRCASKDDGRIGVFPTAAGGTTLVYDCLTAKIGGYACGKTKENVAYPALNTVVRNLDRNIDCQVTQTRMLGTSRDKKSAYLEIKCAGTQLNGQVIQYNTATLKATDMTDCAQATQMTAGGCKLPGALRNVADAAGPSNMLSMPGAADSGITGVTRNVGGVSVRQ